jgi:hypothetical protein
MRDGAKRASPVFHLGTLMVIAAFGSSCGGRSGLGSGDAGPADGGLDHGAAAGLFVEQLAAAACDAVAPCCTGAGLVHDAESCRVMMASRLSGRFPSETSPAVVHDAEAEKACLLAIAQTVGQCTGPSVYWGFTAVAVRSACVRALNGTKPEGARCTSWDECDQLPGATGCQPASDNTMRCTLSTDVPASPASPVRQIGETCNASSNLELCSSDCAPGAFCDTDGKCAAKRSSGPCKDLCHAACADQSYCDAASFTCRAKVPLGGACSTFAACQGPDAFCQSGQCVPSVLDLCTAGP